MWQAIIYSKIKDQEANLFVIMDLCLYCLKAENKLLFVMWFFLPIKNVSLSAHTSLQEITKKCNASVILISDTFISQQQMSRWKHQFMKDYWSQASCAQPVLSWIIPSWEVVTAAVEPFKCKANRDTSNSAQRLTHIYLLPEIEIFYFV